MIKVADLKKSFGKAKVLQGVSVDLPLNTVVAIMGPNGSGKTTFLKSILGLIIPDSGYIKVKDVLIKNNFDYRRHIGYMPQIARYPENLKVRELITLIQDIRGQRDALDTELLEAFKVESLYEKALGTLSGGQKQRVGGAVAFMFNQEIIILDEPTAGLDPVSTEIMKSKILKEKSNNKLILITTHIIGEAEELANQIIYIMDGQILFDSTIENFKSEMNEKSLGKALAKAMTNYEGK